MIQVQSYLDIADNSGARRVMCIKLGDLTAATRVLVTLSSP